MRALPAALPGGAQRAKVTGMARSVDAKTTVEAALPPPSSRMPKVRRAGGGLSLVRAVGASDHGSVECGGETGSGVGLVGGGPVGVLPGAEPWARVTAALSNAGAKRARELSWRGPARQYGLNWKSVAS